MPVYLVRAGENGPVKIGWAVDPKERLAALQCAHHETLTLVRIWDCARAGEGWLHRHFKKSRIRNEWFQFEPEMLITDVPSCLPEDKPTNSRPVRVGVLTTKVIPAVGSASELARRLGVNKTAISQWHRRAVPVDRAREVSRITGVPLHDLRPDIWHVGET